ncbi:autotransporter domain-containing protein, partial [Kaarinaea lacus]
MTNGLFQKRVSANVSTLNLRQIDAGSSIKHKPSVYSKSLIAPLTLAASMSILSETAYALETFSFDQPSYDYSESDGVASVTVNMFSDYGGTCDFSIQVDRWITEGADATLGEDFIMNDPETLTFSMNAPVGSPITLSQTLGISLVQDNQTEDTEIIALRLQNPQVVSGNCSAMIDTVNNESQINLADSVVSGALSIGDVIDDICNNQNPTGDLAARCAELDGLNRSQALQDMSPEEMAAMGTGSINMAQGQIKTVFYQQQARRKGIKGVDLNRLSLNYGGQTIPAGQILGGLLDQATGGAAGDQNKGGRWSGFVSGRVNAGDKQATDIDSGYDYDTVGLTAGADYMFSDQFFLGGALGYAAMASEFGNNGGDLDISSTSLLAYGSYFTPNNLYADFSLIYGMNGYGFNRNIASFNTKTSGDTDGDQFSLSLSGGMDFYSKSLMMSPYLRLDYIDTSIDAYEESGGAGLAL